MSRARAQGGDQRGVRALLQAASAVVVGAVALIAVSADAAAPPYRDAVMTDAPAGYWRLGETSGTTAADQSANGNPGSYQGGATLGVPGALSGDSDPAARLDGVDDRVSVADPASGVLDFGTSDFSLEAWVKTTVNGEQSLLGKRAGSSRYWQVTVTDDPSHAGQLRVNANDGAVTRQVYSTRRVDDGAWHHVVVLFDRDTGISFYVDGASAGFTAGALAGDLSNTAALTIGKISGYPSLSGDVDEVAVYGALLSPERIQTHHGAASGPDTTGPAVTLTAPAHGSSTTDTTPAFAGTAGTAPGDSPTVTVKVYAGADTSGTLVQTLTATRAVNGSYSVDSPALAVGTYTAQASQADAAGNVGLSAANTFSVVEGPPPPPADPVLVGAGDIASCGMTGQDEATADLLDSLPNATVFTTGDNVYPLGRPEEYRDCYDPTWGRAKARTRPTPGNHDYISGAAPGYFGYFGAAAGDPAKGYYSYDLGAWHIIVLNSNCYPVGGCDPGSPQEQWLRADLAAHPTTCTLAYWHHPRFSSGAVHGSDTDVPPLWQALYEHGADVVLNGHEHLYERFLPQTPAGAHDPAHGITQFTVGTGGYVLYGFGTILPNSAARINDTFGVLKLVLHPAGYDWQFLPIAGGTSTDAGTASTHGAPAGPPPPPPPPPDTTPPTISLTSPANGGSTTDATPTFSGTAGVAQGDSAAVTVKVYAGAGTGGTPVQTLTTTRGGTGGYSVDASGSLSPGEYTAQAEQSDAAGNTGRSSTSTFTIAAAPLPGPYTAEVLADAPRAYWRLGEASGTTAFDERGVAPGSYEAGVTLSVAGAISGDANPAARFDGVNDRVNMGDPPALDFGTGDFTAELWLNTTVNKEQAAISKHASGRYWNVTVTDDSGQVGRIRVKLFDGSVTRQVYGPAVRVDNGTWHHLAVVFDRDAGITVYVDGLARSTAGAMAGDVSNAASLLVGKASGYAYFKGDLDEVALYPSALSAERVRRHYDSGRGVFLP